MNQNFDPTTGSFSVTFAANTTLVSAPSLIFLNEKLYYPQGYTVRCVCVCVCVCGHWLSSGKPNRIGAMLPFVDPTALTSPPTPGAISYIYICMCMCVNSKQSLPVSQAKDRVVMLAIASEKSSILNVPNCFSSKEASLGKYQYTSQTHNKTMHVIFLSLFLPHNTAETQVCTSVGTCCCS